MKLNPGVLVLAIGAFVIGVTEFAPMGLLPVIAGYLHVSISAAGLLVSAYALGVVLGAPLMTLTTSSVPQRALLIGLAGIFMAGNLLAAMSDSYMMLLAARVMTALNHGAFFGVGSVVAASLAAPERWASAVAAIFMGLTVANLSACRWLPGRASIDARIAAISSSTQKTAIRSSQMGIPLRHQRIGAHGIYNRHGRTLFSGYSCPWPSSCKDVGAAAQLPAPTFY